MAKSVLFYCITLTSTVLPGDGIESVLMEMQWLVDRMAVEWDMHSWEASALNTTNARDIYYKCHCVRDGGGQC